MLKKTVTYTDFDDVERTEDFYFNLSKTELMKLELENEVSLTDYINRIVNSKSSTEIMQLFDRIIRMSYGKKSDDGKRFEKSPQILDDFVNSAAYDELYMSFFTGDDAEASLANFIEGVMPKKLVEEAKQQPNYPKLS